MSESATSKSKKKKSAPNQSSDLSLIDFGKRIGSQCLELVHGLQSADRPTRRMSVIFFVSLIATLTVSIMTLSRVARPPQEEDNETLVANSDQDVDAEAEVEAGKGDVPAGHGTENAGGHGEEKGAEKSKKQLKMMDLGSFSVELKPIEGQGVRARPFNMADISIVLECDDANTYAYIEKRLVQARNQVTNVFFTLDRSELLTREGKNRIKERILDQINSWLPQGKVQNVFFSKLIVS